MNHKIHPKFIHDQQGLTLIEILIAMLLGMLLLMGISSMFMTNKRIYKEQESMSRLQENARFALEMLMYDIRMAGYAGCSDDITQVTNHLNGASDDDNLFSFSDSVEGSESKGNWQPSGSTDIVDDDDTDHADSSSQVVAGTDGISIRYLDPLNIKIADEMPNVSAELKVTSVGDLEEGDIIAVTDCDSADIMQLTAVQDASLHLQHNAPASPTTPPGNAVKDLTKRYGTDAQVVNFVSRRYYIGNGSGKGPSLYRVHNGGAPLELVEGVQQMQILYGEDTTGDQIADTYVNAANVTGWNNIVSVRLALLLRTIDENNQIELDTKSHVLLGAGGVTTAAANDYHRRRVFTSTVQIRNRSP